MFAFRCPALLAQLQEALSGFRLGLPDAATAHWWKVLDTCWCFAFMLTAGGMVWCAGARRERNNNKHKRLFIGGPGALQDGQRLFYRTGQDGALLRQGIAVINPDGVSGIKCDCCNNVRREPGITEGEAFGVGCVP